MSPPKQTIPSGGIPMPGLIYGTAWKQERTVDLVLQAVQAGFRGIDTACQPKHYHEAGVGAAIHALQERGIPRSALFLQTKFTPLSGQDPQRIPYDAQAPLAIQVAQSFEVSLKNLQTSYLDSWVLHSPLSTHSQTMEAWRAMEQTHQSGRVFQLGLSNCYSLETFKKLTLEARVKPAVLQNRFYADTGHDAELRSWCKDQGVVYQSFWTLTANPQILRSLTLQTLCSRHQKTAPQIFFRALTQMGIVPLTGTCSEQHMKEDLDIFQFELSKDEILEVSRLF